MTDSVKTVRLAIRLWYYNDLLRNPSTGNGNYLDAAGEVAKCVLDLLEQVSIHSVPGNEWEMFFNLRKHCHLVEALLLRPATERDTIQRESREAIEQLCYLMEFQSIAWAAAIETLCLTQEDTWPPNTKSPNC